MSADVLSWINALVLEPWVALAAALYDWLLASLWSPGLSVIAFSLVVNAITTPLYLEMEERKAATADALSRMRAELARIARHYSGRERYFYTRAVHRQFGYRPMDAVWSAGDLYLQAGLFIIAYRFLSTAPTLVGQRFLLLADLSRPDELLWGVSVLPAVMTLLNILSVLLYTPTTRARLVGVSFALLFWLLLRESGSGLVLYWTCNNAWSLARNAILRRWARCAVDQEHR